MIKKMVTEWNLGQMVINMKVNGLMDLEMEKVLNYGLLGKNMRDNTKKIKRMVMVYRLLVLNKDMKANGIKGNVMDME